MPLPRYIARLNRTFTNRLMTPVARVAPRFGIVHHVGRSTGRAYATPVNVFRCESGFVVPLTYGQDSDWVKNVFAAGSARLETRNEILDIRDPAFVDAADALRVIPVPVRLILSWLHVDRFLRLRW